MVENDSIIDQADKIAETFSYFFTRDVSNLNIPRYMDSSIKTDHIKDKILRINEQYKNHPSISAIKNENLNNQFLCRSIPKSEIKKKILNLDVCEASQDSFIPIQTYNR